jgi:hypothetical protein
MPDGRPTVLYVLQGRETLRGVPSFWSLGLRAVCSVGGANRRLETL